MSVLIKGMKMPTSCDGSCPLYDCEFLRCNITYTEPWLGHDGEPIEVPIPIPSDCPLIELPPHGRLIDADEMVASVKRQTEIMREIAKEVDKLKPIANSKELDDVDIVAIAETVEKGVLQEIANAPTILEAEDGE